MEASGKGGGEVRRLHIVYFLSHLDGRIQHPHLIRLHHLARNGVYLRDVKRWLGELRGKNLPEAFAWSYKRRYKGGYVWQDLLDDDLITPISDNEYVLKGSQINPTPLETGSRGEKKARTEEPTQIQTYPPDSASDTPRKSVSSSEINQDSLMFGGTNYDCSTITRCATHVVEAVAQTPDRQPEKNYDGTKKCEENVTSFPSLYRNLLTKKKSSNNKTDPDDSSFSTSSSSSSFCSSSSSSSNSKSSSQKSKSYGIGASGMFRNLITCGGADTNDAVLVTLQKKGCNGNNNKLCGEICKVEKMGGSGRSFGSSWNHYQQQQQQSRRSNDGGDDTKKKKKKLGDFITQTHPKPFGGPLCSQCGKTFKPEKMHKHMISCKGLKALAKSTSSSSTSAHHTAPAHGSSSSSFNNTDSNCNYLLFN